MTKEDAWDIVAGLVENIDADDMTQLIKDWMTCRTIRTRNKSNE